MLARIRGPQSWVGQNQVDQKQNQHMFIWTGLAIISSWVQVQDRTIQGSNCDGHMVVLYITLITFKMIHLAKIIHCYYNIQFKFRK